MLTARAAAPTDLVGSESAKTGIYALLDVDLFNLLLIPETFDMTAGQEAAVIPAAVALCEQRRAFYIVDAPSNRTLDEHRFRGPMEHRNRATPRLTFPPVRIVDPLDGLRPQADAALRNAGGHLRAH